MKIIGLKESGCNNILLWALKHKAKLQSDSYLQRLINSETFYLVRLSDVTFLELFELTKIYRNKIQILEEKELKDPNFAELKQLFPGDLKDSNKDDKRIAAAVENVLEKWNSLALQMHSDNDIILPSTAVLFLPMFNRRFDIEIPIDFVNLISSFTDKESFDSVFNEDYPLTLKTQLINPEISPFKTVFKGIFYKATLPRQYPDKLGKYISRTKHFALKYYNENNLYKFRLHGFSKEHPVTKNEVKYSFFDANKDLLPDTLKQLAYVNAPMKIEFEVQLPLQYMQMLLSAYSREELEVTYESDIKMIINDGIVFKNFVTPMFDMNSEDEEEQNKIKEFNNNIDSYNVRINETINSTMELMIPLTTDEDYNADVCASFAMLPTIYSVKAIITLNMKYVDKYANNVNPYIQKMFKEMLEAAVKLNEDMIKAK